MMDVTLITAEHELVHESQIPMFDEPPAVIVWGSRFFQLSEHDEESATYEEIFGYALV